MIGMNCRQPLDSIFRCFAVYGRIDAERSTYQYYSTMSNSVAASVNPLRGTPPVVVQATLALDN
jgi:hypothetical protein